MYLNERQTKSTKSLSDRIDLATKFRTYAEKFASENYQVMNYGIGGSIVGHLDSTGKERFYFEIFHFFLEKNLLSNFSKPF